MQTDAGEEVCMNEKEKLTEYERHRLFRSSCLRTMQKNILRSGFFRAFADL